MGLKIAVIGSGIAGLTAAHELSQHHHVTLYEKKSELGLGSEGLMVDSAHGPVRVDVPPRVFNALHYPNLCALLDRLSVPTYPIKQEPNFTYPNGRTYFSLWSGKLPFTSAGFFTLPKVNAHNLTWLIRFGPQLLRWMRILKQQQYAVVDDQTTLRPWLRERGFTDAFIREYLYPIWSLMCSANQQELDAYPAKPMAKLFHDFSGAAQAYRISGGTRTLEQKLKQPIKNIYLNHSVNQLVQVAQGVQVLTDHSQRIYDHVVVATEPKIAKQFLGPDLELEQSLLARVPYRLTEMVMHTDENVMPRKRRLWSAVNMRHDHNGEPWATVWMNPIEQAVLPENLFQSWDPLYDITPKRILARSQFHRTLLTPDSASAMTELMNLQNTGSLRRVWFAGSYVTDQVPLLEDGVSSAQRVAQRINEISQANDLSACSDCRSDFNPILAK